MNIKEIDTTLVNEIPACLFVLDPDGSLIYANSMALAKTGETLPRLVGNQWLKRVHPEQYNEGCKNWAKCIAMGNPFETKLRMLGANDQYRWQRLRASPTFDSQDKPVCWYLVITDIDDAVYHQEVMRDHQTQLNLLGERFPGFLWKALVNGEVVYVNRYCEDYLGMTAEEVRKVDWLELIHPDDRDEVIRRWQIVLAGGQWHEHVHRLKSKDGEYRWFQSRITAVKDEYGSIVALHGLMMDAHESVSKAREVRQEERQLRRLVDAMPAMIWRADPNGKIDRWNSSMIETVGKPWDSSETFNLMSKIDPAQVAEVAKRWERSVRLGVPYEDTYRILGNDGKYHWHLVRAEAFRDELGNIVSWYGVHTSIDALKDAEIALTESEHQLRGIIETVPSMLWSASPTGEITHANKQVSDYSGLTLDDFLNLGWEKFIHPDDFEEVAKVFFRSIQTGEAFSIVHRLRRADGEYLWHQALGAPLRDAGGEIVQWYGLTVDIDQRKRAEDHLRETRFKLSKVSRIAVVAELSASIAHELNQPLMSVLANAQATKRWLSATPPNLDETNLSLERIVRDATAAGQTIQQLRALFRREPFKKVPTSLSQIIDEAVRLIEEGDGTGGVAIERDFEGTLPVVSVDPIQFQEVFFNLIANAIEAMEGCPRDSKILIRVSSDQARALEIEVIDNGPGVNDAEKIFDAFVTTKDSGMGIGLAVSRSIVEAHDGQLSARNNADYGATFTIRLPISASDRLEDNPGFASAAG